MYQKLKEGIGSLINRYHHLWILSYFIVYLVWFDYLEKTVTTHFHVIHVGIDDYIPFCEYFIIPYLLWFAYVAWGVIYFAIHDRNDFYKLCKFLFTGMTVFLIVSTVYPNGHYLRPHSFARDNLFTDLCRQLYTIDTATNLFPSIHVYNSLSIYLAVKHSELFQNKKYAHVICFLMTSSIVLSTVFLKQHSIFDVVTAFLLAYVMNYFIYIRKPSNFRITQKTAKHVRYH